MLEQTRPSAEPTATSVEWWASVRRADDAFASLRPEWDDLVSRARAATPFQSYAWLRSWWDTYGTPRALRLVLVHADGRLVAAAPLMLRRTAGCPVLVPLGTPFSDFTDVLVADDVAAEATSRLVTALLGEPDWQALDLPEARAGAAASTLLWPAWPGRRWQAPASLCLDLAAVEFGVFVAGLPGHSRKTVRRRLNQLARSGLDIRTVVPDDAERAVADLLRLHGAQWQGRGGNPAHRTAEFRRFLAGAAADMIDTGEAALIEYRLEGCLVASSLVVLGRELAGGYLYGALPDLRDRVDVTTMLLADTMPLAYRHGCSTMSMLRGGEDHKRRWRPVESPNRALVLARPGSARGIAYGAGVCALRTVKPAVAAKAPWLRALRDRIRRSRR